MAEEPVVRVSARDAVGGSTEEAGGAGGGVEIVGASGGDDPAVDTLGENDGEPLGKPDGKDEGDDGDQPYRVCIPRAMRPKPSSIPSSDRTILNSLRSVRCCVVFVVYAISDFLCTCSTRNARRKVVFEEESALLVRKKFEIAAAPRLALLGASLH